MSCSWHAGVVMVAGWCSVVLVAGWCRAGGRLVLSWWQAGVVLQSSENPSLVN